MTPENLKRAHETARVWDEERGSPWPYEFRPCFKCVAIAVQIFEDLPFCDRCANEERASAPPERVEHMRRHDAAVAAHKKDLRRELHRNRVEESAERQNIRPL